MTIQRYDTDLDNYHGQKVGLHPHEKGCVVLYEDHVREVLELKKMIEELKVKSNQQ